MKLIGPVALLLVVVGALNWGLVGLLGMDVVAKIFGDMTSITKIVYIVVGLAGVYVAVTMLPKQLAK
ncbi:MAG: hypothetical protein A3A27_00200 [Candidatus Wildermuthbacteria bacterium RIFCSPLOWO2_01_FULL_47_18]|uniref:DUF378 domain-containing protein n=2 Tax=Candidatus Wildermuthiibacteriota TaxID=1817923 RepID=A0A1G2RIT6_9BACT|nr:MAG: hypothetical protein A3J68_01270 [Candidatus Wildermuthbacteria bacterium RIFCSPHIGHO2_02_FULL_48_16]OHA72764.1 MAG: hypothetical protein A3A27_00200 [Candidatus Wildermuthbacteria bacterium RIFCSPLOWO2_01_FULL_47_18]